MGFSGRSIQDPVSFEQAHSILQKASDATEKVLESEGVFDYNESWEMEDDILSYGWRDGRKQVELFFGIVGNRVHVQGYVERPEYGDLEETSGQIINAEGLETAVKQAYNALDRK